MSPRGREKETATAAPERATAGEGSAFGHGDHSFTLQAIMEMQKSIGELKAIVESVKTSVESTKSKVDDLMRWKHLIIGGAVVLGVVISAAVFLVNKFSEYVTIKAPSAQVQVQMQSPITAPPITPAPATSVSPK
jgi:hypothetical protein